jgi:hypothetical protein
VTDVCGERCCDKGVRWGEEANLVLMMRRSVEVEGLKRKVLDREIDRQKKEVRLNKATP